MVYMVKSCPPVCRRFFSGDASVLPFDITCINLVDMIAKFLMLTKSTNRMDALCKGETWVLICTDLVARGVDFRVVNMVINYNLPESGITYVHRIGRTGRAGRKGKAITLFTEADSDNLRTIGRYR